MNATIGNLIRNARRAQKLTLRVLSERTGIDYSLLSRYENGIVNPSLQKLCIIASALNISEDAFLSDIQVEELSLSSRRRSQFSRTDDNQFIVSASIASRVVIDAAKGKCELCKNTYPDGELFLESHYVVWLQDGGEPTIDNVVALCPNCHKRIHIYNDPADTDTLLKIAKSHI